MKQITLIPAGASLLLLSGFAYSQSLDTVTELDAVTVSANRVPTELSKTGSSVDVITERELQSYTQLTVKDYLELSPSINFSQSGGVGAQAGLSLRGANQNYILVRIDGVDISDPSGAQVSARLEHLLVEDIARIEVLRGSQSSLYGGQAVGGVIDITTKRGKSGVEQSAGLELGERSTLRGHYNLRVGAERGEYSLGIQHLNTSGFSAADENNGNRENDGYDNTTVNLRGSYDLNDQLSFKGSLRHTRRDIEFDDFLFGTGPVDDTVGNRTKGRHTAASAGLALERLNGQQSHEATLSFYDTQRDTDSSFPGTFDGQRIKLDYVGNHTFSSRWNSVFGASYSQEDAQTSGGLNNDSEITGVFVQVGFNPAHNWFLTGAVRNDHHSEFGNQVTWRTTAAYQVTPLTKIRASAGTGFRAPSNFELFDSQFGNTDLEPETSTSFDIGIDQKLFGGRGEASLTYFSLDTDDLIQFSFPDGYTQVNGDSERNGFELGFKYKLDEFLNIRAHYTRIQKADQPNGSSLLRVPEDNLAVGVNYQRDRWAVNATGKYIAGSRDNDAATGVAKDLDDYFVMNTKLTYSITPSLQVYGRIDNLFDEEYQTVSGYGTADRTAFVGAKIRF